MESEKRLILNENLPQHIAIIMDGNGRWAKRHRLPRIEGHRAGAVAAKEVVKACGKVGVPVLTLYAFSVENWARPRTEVNALMMLLEEYIQKEMEELVANNVQFRPIGRLHRLPASTQKQLYRAVELTRGNSGLILNLALNYGGRSEIVDAVKAILPEVQGGLLRVEELNEKTFSRFLYTAGLPDPDLLIRTSGEMRLSNFLLWQLAYAEIWVTPVLWPDFTPNHLMEAIAAYQKRERRFGRISGE